MAARDYNQRGGGGGGGVLPNLVTPEGIDVQVVRKRQYLAELQQQAEADRARKAGERPGGRGAGGGGGGPYGGAPYGGFAQYPSPPRKPAPYGGSPQPFALPGYAERGKDFAARLKAGFDAALQQAHQQVAGGPDRYPDGPLSGGRDQGGEIMNAMRRWENMFTAQVSASIQAVSELNSHVVHLEEQIMTQNRDKQLLRERVEQAEMAQRELQAAKLENETILRQVMRDEQDKARRLQQEMSELRETLGQLSQQQAAAKVQAEKALDDLRAHHQRHRSVSGTIEERMLALEARLAETTDTIAARREQEAQESRRRSKALEDTADTMAQVISRVKKVEERVVPDMQAYVAKSNDDFWAPSRAEISTLKALVEELRARIDQVDDSASALIVSAREEAARERRAARDERVAQASESLARFELVNKALSEEKDARVLVERKCRKELESMTKEIANSIRDSDAEHAGLVEAVHNRVMARIVQQGDVAGQVQEALESKRAFLEEVVRAEIASRFAGMEDMRAQMETLQVHQKQELAESKEEVGAQLKLLQVKVKANGRAIRNQSATVETARRIAEQVRQDLEAELLAMSKTQSQAEEQLRASFKTQMADVHLQLSALREMVQGMDGLGNVTQEDRDLDQDKKIEAVRVAMSEASARIDALHDRNESERSRLHKMVVDLESKHALLKEDVGEKQAMLGIASEALRENFQSRLESTDQHIQDMRVQMLDVLKDLHEGPEALFLEAQRGIDACNKELEALRHSAEERYRSVQDATSSTCQELAMQVETAQSRAALMQQHLRGEHARLDEADKAVRALFDAHARENKLWKEDTQARLEANHEAALRVRQVFSEELRQMQAGMGEAQRAQDLKWQLMDSKLTDDSRRVIQAMESFRAAHELLKASTDDNFAQMLAQDEKNRTRLWADIEANRAHADKHAHELRARLGEEEHARKEADEALHVRLQEVRQEVGHAKQALADAMEHEARTRAAADEALKDAEAALRADTDSVHRELARSISELDARTAGALAGLKSEVEEAVAAQQKRFERVESEVQRVQQGVDALDRDHQASKALLADVQETLGKDRAIYEKSLGEVVAAARVEVRERQAAITEVYRRQQMAREVDMLMTQVAEAALMEKIHKVRTEVMSTGEKTNLGVNVELKRLSAVISTLQEEDVSIKGQVDQLKITTAKKAEELRAADEALSRQVDETQKSVVLKTSQMQEKLQSATAKIEDTAAKQASDMAARVQHLTANVEHLTADVREQLRKEMEERETELKKEMKEREASVSEELRKEREERETELKREKEEREASVREELRKEKEERETELKREKEERETSVREELQKEKEEREAELKKEREERQAGDSKEAEAAAELARRLDALEAKEREGVEVMAQQDASASQKLAELVSKHKDLHDSLQTLQGERAKDMENAIALDTKISEDIKKLESRLEEKIDGGSAASSAEMASKVEEMKVKVQELGEKVEGFQGQVAEHADKISELKQACLSNLEQIKQIKVEVGKCGTDLGEVRERVVGVEEKVAAVDSLVEKLEATEGKVVSLEEKHAGIEGSYVTKEALETALAENSAEMDVELKPLSSKVDELAKKIVELESGGVSDEAVAALECIKQIKQQVSLAAVAAEVDDKTDALDNLIKQVQGDMDKKAKGTEEDDAGKLQVRLGDLERSTTEMKERVTKLDEQVEKSVDNGIAKVEENLNFRLDSMKIDELKKDLVALKNLGNLNSSEIDRLDQAAHATNAQLGILKELVHEILSDDK